MSSVVGFPVIGRRGAIFQMSRAERRARQRGEWTRPPRNYKTGKAAAAEAERCSRAARRALADGSTCEFSVLYCKELKPRPWLVAMVEDAEV